MNKFIWLKCKYDSYYKIINKLKNLHLNIYEIKVNNNYFYIKVIEKDYEFIKKNLISYSFKIYKKTGLSLLKNIVKKNYLFMLAIIIGCIVFYICNNTIIDIEINHENSEIRELVKEELYKRGIKKLSFKKKYKELEKIKKEIINNYPTKIDWLEIETHGMKYIVKLEERIITPEVIPQPFCEVYAKEAGLITKIKVTRGTSVVNIGDYVKQNDLLITGNIIYNEEIKKQVCASGSVYAEKWYTINIFLPLKYEETVKTGKKKYNFIYENNNNKIKILKSQLKNYEVELINIFDLFDRKLYLEKDYETIKNTKKYSEEEALNKCLDLAVEKVKMKIDSDEEIIIKKVLKKVVNDSTMDVEVFIVTNEKIN